MSGNCANFFDEENSLIADSVGFFPFYGYEDQAAANQTYWVWAIPSNCKDPAAAFEFIAWLCSYEVEKASSMDMYTISAITELATDRSQTLLWSSSRSASPTPQTPTLTR